MSFICPGKSPDAARTSVSEAHFPCSTALGEENKVNLQT